VAYSPDGSELLTATQGNEIRAWSVAEGIETRRLNSVPDGMRAIDWSQDGKFIAGGGDSKTVIIWDAATGDPVQTIQQHEAPITAMAFAPDGSYIASGDESGKAIVWLLTGQAAGSGQQGGVTVTFRQDLGSSVQGEMRHVAYSTDGLMIATGAEGSVILWDGGSLIDRYVMDIGTPARAPDVAFSPDGSVLVATVDDDIRAWSTSTGEELEDLKGHKGYPINVAFSPDGKYLVSSGEDHTVITWDTNTREQVGSFDALESITAMAHAPDD
jgi:WD40 repeat protein